MPNQSSPAIPIPYRFPSLMPPTSTVLSLSPLFPAAATPPPTLYCLHPIPLQKQRPSPPFVFKLPNSVKWFDAMERNNNNRFGGTTQDKGCWIDVAKLFASVWRDDYKQQSLVQLWFTGRLFIVSLSLACGAHGGVGVVMEGGEGLEW